MKRLLAVIMTSVLTWWMVGWYLQKEASSAEFVGSWRLGEIAERVK